MEQSESDLLSGIAWLSAELATALLLLVWSSWFAVIAVIVFALLGLFFNIKWLMNAWNGLL